MSGVIRRTLVRAMAKRIGTHDGKFHADEALACAILRMTSEFADAAVVRTRDADVLSRMDAVVDVGGVYDPRAHRYDHHQPTFQGTYDAAHRTLLSSAGLVFKHFAPTILREKFNLTDENAQCTVLRKLYDDFVEPLDGIDNGVPRVPADVSPAYAEPFSICAHVALLNPAWNDPAPDADASFMRAVAILGDAFRLVLERTVRSWLPARQIVLDALRSAVHSADPRILVLEQHCPWQDHLHALEAAGEATRPVPVLYVLFRDSTARSWRIQAVAVAPDRFECRRGLPEAWRGLRDAELDAATGVPGGVFVHRSGFIGGHSTFEGALSLAHKALLD